MSDISGGQRAVLTALVRGCKEAPMTSREVGKSNECRGSLNGRHPGSWAGSFLRVLEKKGLAYTDGPGAAKGYWRPTEAGRALLSTKRGQ